MSAAAAELVRRVKANGGRLTVEGERLVIEPREAGISLLAELRRHKPEIIELLAQRPVTPAGVRLLSYKPATPPVRLSEWETVIDTGKFIESTLRQLEGRLNGKHWLAGNWTLSILIERLALVGCVVELHDKEAMLQ